LFAFIQSGSWKKTAGSILASLGVFFAIVLPFAISQPITWIFDLYMNGLTQYPFASLNAANLWSLFGQNFAYDTTTLLLPIKYWGIAVLVLTTVAAILLYFRSTHGSRAILTALFIIASVCIFGTHIHERYLYPVLAFCIFAFISSKDRRFIFVMAGFTFSLFVNQAAILAIATRTVNYNIPADDLILRLISLWNIGPLPML
jgi:dolichyl-phosphate-mannose-protein mannosyltransferase